MAIARIITRSPQDVESLAEQLRQRGYTVEIAAPGEIGNGAAELEITAETCSIPEALVRASQLARGSAADVLVSPGIWESQPVLAQRQPEPEPVPEPAAHAAPIVEPLPPRAVQPVFSRGKVVREALAGFAGAVGDVGEQVGNSVVQAGHRLAGRIVERRRQLRERRQSPPTAVVPIRERAAAPAAASVVTRRLPQIANPRTPSREREWKLAAIFSTAVALAVMLAWLVASHRASSPIPAGMVMRSNGIQQQVPFGPVVLRPPAVATAERIIPPTPKPQSVHLPAAAPRAQTPQQDDEVIVRHFTKPKPAANRTTQSNNGVKRFSDLE